jgi:hypothetical protein
MNSTLNMNNNNITNCNSITDTTGNFVTTNTPTTGDNSQNIATTAFVSTAISNIPAVSGYAYLSAPAGATQNFTTQMTFDYVPKVLNNPVAVLTDSTGAFQTFTTPINFTNSLQSNSVTVATLNNLPVNTQSYLYPYILSTINPAYASINLSAGSPYQETLQQSTSASAQTSFFSNPVYINFGSIGGLPNQTPILALQFNNPNYTTSSVPIKPWSNYPPPVGYYWVYVNTGSITQSWPVQFFQNGPYSYVVFYSYYNMGAGTTGYYDFSSLGLIPP